MAVSVKGKVIEYDIKINDKGLLQVASSSGKLRAAFSDLGGAIKAISADIDRQTAAHGRTVSVVEAEINAFNKLAIQYKNQPAQLDLIRQKLDQLGLEYTQLDIAAKQSAASMNGNISNAGLAGAVLTEFNRTVSDANYGFRAIANNLSQMSTLFITLQSKVTESAFGMGKFGGTLKMLGNQLNGPLGIILGFQVVISAIERFTMSSDKAKNATAEFNKELLLQTKVLEGLKAIYDDANTNLEQRISLLGLFKSVDKDFREALERGNRTDEEKIRLGTEYFKIQKELSSLEEQRSKLSAKLNANKIEEFLTQEELNEQLDKAKLMSEGYNDAMRSSGRTLKASLQPLVEFYDTTKELTEVNQQLIDTQKQINNLLGINDEALEGSVAYYEDIIRKEEELLDKTLVTGLARLAAEQRIQDARNNIERITGEKRKKNAEEVADFIEDLNDDVATSLVEREEDKLAITRDKEIERLKIIGATEEQIKEIKELYNKLILQARQERLDKEKEEEEKYNNEVSKLQKKLIEEQNKDNKEYVEERISELKKQLENTKLDAKTRAELALELHKYIMQLKGIEDKADKESEKDRQEAVKKQLELLSARQDGLKDTFSATRDLLSELESIGSNRYDREINQLNNERELIRSNNALTKEEKEKQLTELQRRENKYREAQIKQEQKFFMIKQAMAISEMIMNGQFAMQRLSLLGVESVTSATTSVGKFMAALGPFGIPAFALAIGGVIASIISSVSRAKAEIAGLTNAPVSLGGSSGSVPAIQAPDFNVVGASAQNQLAQAIAGKEQQPIKAYVVSDDVTSAQELDRKIVQGASI